MEDNSKIAYIKILIDTLRKKDKVLISLMDCTVQQKEFLEEENFSMEKFESIMDNKDNLISNLINLEEGFEYLYQRVEEEIKNNNSLYSSLIIEAQELIRCITDTSVKIQALEFKNKDKLIQQLAEKRLEIRTFKNSSHAADKYHQNMANQHQDGQSYFLDKKK
jgi:flagellar biosynthesis/type III secretory pathway chaperone